MLNNSTSVNYSNLKEKSRSSDSHNEDPTKINKPKSNKMNNCSKKIMEDSNRKKSSSLDQLNNKEYEKIKQMDKNLSSNYKSDNIFSIKSHIKTPNSKNDNRKTDTQDKTLFAMNGIFQSDNEDKNSSNYSLLPDETSEVFHFEKAYKYQYFPDNNFTIIDNEGRGNCLFESILSSYGYNSEFHFNLRQTLCEFILANEEFYTEMVFLESGMNVRDYVRQMNNVNIWGGMIEIHAAAALLECNINIYRRSELDNNNLYIAERFQSLKL